MNFSSSPLSKSWPNFGATIEKCIKILNSDALLRLRSLIKNPIPSSPLFSKGKSFPSSNWYSCLYHISKEKKEGSTDGNLSEASNKCRQQIVELFFLPKKLWLKIIKHRLLLQLHGVPLHILGSRTEEHYPLQPIVWETHYTPQCFEHHIGWECHVGGLWEWSHSLLGNKGLILAENMELGPII